MKIRQKILLERLLNEKTLDLKVLEQDFSVTRKTLQNDFQELNDYLKTKNFVAMIEVKRGIAKFLGDSITSQKIGKVIQIYDFYTYRLSTSERVMMILTYLLLATNYITISYLCEKLYVSRSTINSDLIFVKEWCQKHDINLILKKKNGIIIHESSSTKQQFLVKILKNLFDLNKDNQIFYKENNFYTQLFQGVDLRIIRTAIVKAEEQFHFNFSDEIYHELVIQIASLLFMPFDKNETTIELNLNYSTEKEMAAQIIKDINSNLPIKLSQKLEEKIALYIKSATFHLKFDDKENTQLPYIQVIAEQLIQAVSNLVNIDFKWNRSLFNALTQHLSGLIFRTQHNIIIQNPLKDKLITEEQDLYSAIKNSINIISRITHTDLSVDEIAYLLIYFASAKNEAQNSTEHEIPSVAILCNTGLGTAQIIKNNLDKYFAFNVKKIVAQHQLNSNKALSDIDFIISTIPLNSNIPYVQVNPMLKIKDVYSIYQLMFELGFNPPIRDSYLNNVNKNNKSDLSKAVYKLLQKYSHKNNEKILFNSIQDLIKNYKIKSEDAYKGDIQYMLSELLTVDNIELDVIANNWQEAVSASGGILERNNIVEHIYIEEAIKNVEDSGPYIVVTKGVAIPHANSNTGVHKTAISLAKLKSPVCFGNVDNDPVKYVFTLATINANSHLKALKDLVSLLGDNEFFQVIDRAKKPDEIIKYIKNFESEKGVD